MTDHKLIETDQFATHAELVGLYPATATIAVINSDTVRVSDGEWRKVDAWQFWRNPS